MSSLNKGKAICEDCFFICGFSLNLEYWFWPCFPYLWRRLFATLSPILSHKELRNARKDAVIDPHSVTSWATGSVGFMPRNLCSLAWQNPCRFSTMSAVIGAKMAKSTKKSRNDAARCIASWPCPMEGGINPRITLENSTSMHWGHFRWAACIKR